MNNKYIQMGTGKIAIAVVYLFTLYALYLSFVVAPAERFMGPVQRIFYFHVGSAIASYVSFAVLLCAALAYLAHRSRFAEIFLKAAPEVALLFTTITLTSGMIWGHSAWNTWFRWEPRLVTFLLLWLIALSIVLLWRFGSEQGVVKHVAVLSIIGALMVPIVVYSVKLMPNIMQLHPQVVENQGLKHPSYYTAMFASMGALVLLQFLLIGFRARIAALELSLGE
ncbi:MAG: cytochrome c biogenesis protein CcsA [Bdellovibrionota bacterium]